jgi:hypothetical protein
VGILTYKEITIDNKIEKISTCKKQWKNHVMEWVKRSGQENYGITQTYRTKSKRRKKKKLEIWSWAGAGILVAKEVNTRGMGRDRRTM